MGMCCLSADNDLSEKAPSAEGVLQAWSKTRKKVRLAIYAGPLETTTIWETRCSTTENQEPSEVERGFEEIRRTKLAGAC